MKTTERQEAENEARLKALREAASVGLADLAAGRFRTFDMLEPLRHHLAALAEDTIVPKATKPNDKR